MNYFANIFKPLFEEKNGKVYSFSKFSGIDRTIVYKMLNGTREPTGIDVDYHIEDYLCLNNTERERLEEAYYITKLGAFQYFGHLEAKSFLLEFSMENKRPQVLFPYTTIQMDDKEKRVLEGANNVNLGIENLLSQESRANPDTRILISEMLLDDMTLMICSKLMEDNPDLNVTHIIMLDDNRESSIIEEHQFYNMRCLRKLLPVLVQFENYDSRFCYNNIASIENSPTFLTNIIIVNDYVILYSKDRKYGVILHDAEMLAIYSDIMENFLKSSLQFASSLHYKEYCQELIQTEMYRAHRQKSHAYAFHAGLSITLALDEHETYSRDHIVDEFPEKNHFVENCHQYISYYHDGYERIKDGIFELYTKQGIDYFCRTGFISELHPNICIPLRVSERIELLERWKTVIQTHEIYMIDFPEFSGDSTLSMFTTHTKTYLTIATPNGRLRQAVIDETSVTRVFFDYLDYLFQNKRVENEDAVAYLNGKIEELKLSLT